MSLFISWIEHNNKLYFMTKHEWNTKKGKFLIEDSGRPEDISTHQIIRLYFDFETGFNRQCTDFYMPYNFPPEIQKAVKDRRFEGMGTPVDILTPNTKGEYENNFNPSQNVLSEKNQKLFWDIAKNQKTEKKDEDRKEE